MLEKAIEVIYVPKIEFGRKSNPNRFLRAWDKSLARPGNK
jgi:hypothetical protein